MMGQVKAWISKAIPTGVSISNADNIDAVARHSIFSNSVRPAVETEMTEYRFGFLSLLSNQLIMMPHRTNTTFKAAHQPTKAFEFNAKAKSVAPLAVDADSTEMMRTADRMSLAYAMLLNNMSLLAEDKPGRFDLMGTNFTEAADSLKGLQKYDVVRQRFEALASVAKGLAFLESGNAIESRPLIMNGLDLLVKAKQATMTNMEFGSTYLAVEQEEGLAKAMAGIVDVALYDPSVNALQILEVLKRVTDVATLQYRASPEWAGMVKNMNRYTEIFSYVSAIIASKAGKGGIPITSGQGSVLLPFWSVELRYSFMTGALWSKKSVEASEPLLVSASFPTDTNSLSNPKIAITDIFATRPGGFFDGLKGSETSISQSGEIKTMVQSVAENSVGNRKAVVPVSTKSEAEAFVVRYLKQCTSDDSKLKLIKPTVDKLIYIPCEIADSGISLPSLGKMSPKSAGRTDLIKTLLI
jgi:acyl-CoA-binding protein